MDTEMERRLNLLVQAHQNGELGHPYDCAAYSEGQHCCIDALTNDEAWYRISPETPAPTS